VVVVAVHHSRAAAELHSLAGVVVRRILAEAGELRSRAAGHRNLAAAARHIPAEGVPHILQGRAGIRLAPEGNRLVPEGIRLARVDNQKWHL